MGSAGMDSLMISGLQKIQYQLINIVYVFCDVFFIYLQSTKSVKNIKKRVALFGATIFSGLKYLSREIELNIGILYF